jgi:hypothetical protein
LGRIEGRLARVRGHRTRHFVPGLVLLAVAFNPSSALAGTPSPSPTSVDFGNVVVASSSPQDVTITNSGTTTTISGVSFSAVSGGGGFSADTGCDNKVLGNGGSCVVAVTFTPGSRGAKAATLDVSHDGSGAVSVPLEGSGVAPVASPSPSSLAFGSQHIGTTSTSQTVTVANNGDTGQNLSVSSATIILNAASYVVTNGCGSSVAPGGHCDISVAFKPTSIGAAPGTLRITSNDPVNPTRDVTLSGTGTRPFVTASAGPFAFGGQHAGTQSPPMVVTVSNGPGANEAATISAALSGANPSAFTITANTCDSPVAPNSSCQVSVAFAPTSVSGASASLDLSTNDPTTPNRSVALSGNGTTAILSVPDGPLAFGTQDFGTAFTPITVTIRNAAVANEAAAVTAAISGADAGAFAILSDGCASGLPPGASCDLEVGFAPGSPGAKTANLDLSTNDASDPTRSISLSGSTTTPALNPDITPPETTITKAPSSKTFHRRATFAFSADELGASFECSFDGRAFAPCTSPTSVRAKPGRHTFQVRSTDAAGNIGTAAQAKWKVKKRTR